LTIVPLVEGYGEVEAVPELVRRICHHTGRFDVDVQKCYRSKRSSLGNPDKLRREIETVFMLRRPDAILVLFDADDDCPVNLSSSLRQACEEAPVSVELVIANREYEAWFLGAVSSLSSLAAFRNNLSAFSDPETPRNAKGRLESFMTEPYDPRRHQAAFSAKIDIEMATASCRSFRKLRSAITKLTT